MHRSYLAGPMTPESPRRRDIWEDGDNDFKFKCKERMVILPEISVRLIKIQGDKVVEFNVDDAFVTFEAGKT
ncbi:hypothetical protein RCL_jg26287.t1 [Rhizophagus clarus]|uniref:Uncharacterized protein n=1 Tax=Rhizophagus clarus TaxID=94130 RepID=A0A8H3KZ64_9GLOM|nr:hypothetical protein RCL_jg26287.t1 [Rhizophagus clarus]